MSRLSSQRTYPSFPVHLVSPIVRICKTLRYHLGEVRSFYRFPRRLRLPAAKSFGVQLILFGIPFGDWNRMLADPLFWDSVGAVSEVWRIPAFRFLLSLVSPMAVVIPMKGEHAIAAARSRRGLFPDERALRILNNKREFQSYIESNGLDRYCPPCYACPEDATFPCVVKRLDLSGSVGIEVAASRRHLDDILRTPVFAGRPYLLQALVPGELEYATFCVADRGRITWHWTFVSTMAGPAVVKTEDNDKDRRTIEAAPRGAATDRGRAATARLWRAVHRQLQDEGERRRSDLRDQSAIRRLPAAARAGAAAAPGNHRAASRGKISLGGVCQRPQQYCRRPC